MQLKLLYFARLRHELGLSEEMVQVPPAIMSVEGLITWLQQRGEVWQRELGGQRPFRVAVDQDMVALTAPLHDGAEVALFPPVTGG